MPHFSAPEALSILTRRGLDLPFIIVSGAITEEVAVMAMRAGAQDFVVKPWNNERFVASIRAAIDNPRVRPPAPPPREISAAP